MTAAGIAAAAPKVAGLVARLMRPTRPDDAAEGAADRRYRVRDGSPAGGGS